MIIISKKIFLLLLWVLYTTDQAKLKQQLMLQSNDCGCVIYECTINGEGTIIWSGSAFECHGTSNEIAFLSAVPGYVTCNYGAVKARRINYTSQLIVMDRSLSGKNIECIYDNGTNSIVKGNQSLPNISVSELPIKLYVQLVNVHTDLLIFKWNQSVQCSSDPLRYEINTTGCGNCPNHTIDDMIVICEHVPNNSTGEKFCMFTVKAVVCENNENSSNSVTVTVTLKAPLVNITEVLPTYKMSQSQEIIQLKTTFTDTVEPYNFSDSSTIDGSALFYIINYTKSNSSVTCASANIQAASCLNQTCEHTSSKSDISACLTSPSIMVTGFGTNRLGNGSTSNPVLIETTNRFVNVTVSQSSSTIMCTFLDWQNGSNSLTTCTVHAYRPSTNNGCDDVMHSTCDRLYTKTSSSNSDTVIIRITDFRQALSISSYCFSVLASNGSYTAEVIGSFGTTDLMKTETVIVTTITVVLMLFGIACLGVIAAISAVLVKKRKSIIQTHNNRDSTSEEEHYTLPPSLHIHSTSQETGVCTSPLLAESEVESRNGTNTMIYADISPNAASKGMVMLPLDDDRVEYAQVQHTIQTETESEAIVTTELVDEYTNINLDNLLIHLRDDVTPKWYELGVIIGVPKETLDKYSEHPPEQCIIEVLDYWLMLYRDKLTWKDVAHALKELNLHQLSEKILQTDSLSHKEIDHQFQQNLDSLAIPLPSMSLSNIDDAETKEATDQLIDTAEGTPPPPLPPKCKELLLECAND